MLSVPRSSVQVRPSALCLHIQRQVSIRHTCIYAVDCGEHEMNGPFLTPRVCMQSPNRSHKSVLSTRRMRSVCGASVESSNGDATAQVQEKVDEAVQKVQEAQEEIIRHRKEGQEEADQIRKDQRFERAKGALELKEKGHKLEPSAGHEQPEGPLKDSKEAQTRENASSRDAQVPDPSISRSVCDRLLALEELRATKPFRKLISKGEPVPQLTHHYAAAAWWAVVG